MAVKRGLNKGKGLEALIPQKKTAVEKTAQKPAAKKTADKPIEKKTAELFGQTTEEKAADRQTAEKGRSSRAASDKPDMELRITEIIPNTEQPRKNFDEELIDELADSIRQYGVLQPLLVQKKGKYYELIAGERRWRAAKKAGLKKVPVIIRSFSDQETMEISLIENIQRENLNAIEEAKAYRTLLDEFHLRQEDLAKKVSKNRSTITNALRLLKLDEKVQEMISAGELSMGHARALLGLKDEKEQYVLAQRVQKENLSVRETENLVRKLNKGPVQRKQKTEDPQLQAVYEELEHRMQKATGTKVLIKKKNGSKGKIEIEYYSQSDLERIIDMIC